MVIKDEQVVVHCSPCQQIGLISPAPAVALTTSSLEAGPPFEHVCLPLRAPDLPFRVEVIDEGGRKAWTNPVFPEEI